MDFHFQFLTLSETKLSLGLSSWMTSFNIGPLMKREQQSNSFEKRRSAKGIRQNSE